MALDRLVDPELGGDQRVMQKVAPDLIRRIGEIVGGEEEAWRSDAVGRDDDKFRALKLRAARVAVDEMDARGPSVGPLLDLERARIGPQPRSRKQGLGPYRERELAHRAARAAVADATAVAGGAAIIVLRDDTSLGGPPMPAELVEGLGEPASGAGEGQRPGGARVARRHGEVAGEAARADETIGFFVEGREVLIGNRPVRLQTVLVALAEVGGPEARPNRAVDIGRAADPVPHQNLRGVRLNWIVVWVMALVDVGAPVRASLPSPV